MFRKYVAPPQHAPATAGNFTDLCGIQAYLAGVEGAKFRKPLPIEGNPTTRANRHTGEEEVVFLLWAPSGGLFEVAVDSGAPVAVVQRGRTWRYGVPTSA